MMEFLLNHKLIILSLISCVMYLICCGVVWLIMHITKSKTVKLAPFIAMIVGSSILAQIVYAIITA